MASEHKPKTHFPTIRDLSPRDTQHISAGKAGKTQTDYMIYKLEDIVISSYNVGGSANGDVLP